MVMETMLILTRKINQTIEVNVPNVGKVTFMILGVERDRVKVGIAAPESLSVLRGELLERENWLEEMERKNGHAKV